MVKKAILYVIACFGIFLAVSFSWLLSRNLNGSEPVEKAAREIEESFSQSIFEIIRTTAPRGEEGFGTAFVVTKQPVQGGQFLYQLLTCAHVADDSNLQETGWELRQPALASELIQPRLVQVDPLTDLALFEVVLKTDLPVVQFAKSAELRRLEPIVAMGNTRGRGITTVTGQVTDPQKGREAYPFPIFQTNIATAPGNSGSPLFNLKKEVVGIYFSYDKQAMGFVSFNIHASNVLRSYRAMQGQRDKNGISFGDWGIVTQALEPKQRAGLLENEMHGVLISRVYPGSSAETAGLQAGDLLLKVDNRTDITEINKDTDLYKLNSFILKSGPEGAPIPLEILRDEEKKTLEIRPDTIFFGRREAYHTPFGFTVVDMEPDDARKYTIPTKGVWTIFDYETEKSQWLHGTLYNRSLITHLNGLPTPTVGDFKKGLEAGLAQRDEKPYLMLRTYQTSRKYPSIPDRWVVVRIDLGSQ